MQPENDDIGNLFRRAAEGYPLNTDSADWNAVEKKLIVAKSINKDSPSSNNKKHKHLLWLLLLLPLFWIYYYTFNKTTEISSQRNIENKNLNGNSISKNTDPISVAADTVDIAAKNSQVLTHTPYSKHNKKESLKSIVTESSGTPGMLSSRENSLQIEVPSNNSGLISDDNHAKATQDNTDKITSNKLSEKNIEGNQADTFMNNEKEIKNSQKKIRKQLEKGLYAGIIASPDISTVKFQSVKKTGVSIGILIGYQFNKQLSLESGIVWNKKYYYSDGKYFDTQKVNLPAYAKIKNLDGWCKMIEVPVNIRYNFKSFTKTNLSVSAGLSSYIMKSESYTYTIERNGQQYPRSASYTNSSTDLLAVINVSPGVNHNLGKGSVLRLEPYIKIPLKGIGTGSLPIMSSGINVSITKILF